MPSKHSSPKRRSFLKCSDIYYDPYATIPTHVQVIPSTPPYTPFSWEDTKTLSPSCHNTHVMHTILFRDSDAVAFLNTRVKELLPQRLKRAPRPPTPNFQILPTTNHGVGMFSKQEVPAGGLILVEHPILVTPYSLSDLQTPLTQLYTDLVDNLAPKVSQAFLKLATSRPMDHTASFEEVVDDILRTNGFAIKLAVPETSHRELALHRGIFLNASRCNHSCGPNARWQWDQASFSLSLEAVRPIQPGEEITVSYVPPDRPRRQRQEDLWSTYGFECHCAACNLPNAAAVNRSDQARQTLREFWDQIPSFEEWCLDTNIADDTLTSAHKRALYLMDQEGLQMLDYAKHVDALGMCYGALENLEMFSMWVGVALELRLESNIEQAAVLEKWLAKPTGFPVWGWRKTFCGGKKRT